MNKKFQERLTEYLESECDDFGLKYNWIWQDDYSHCKVEITTEYYADRNAVVNFKYDESKDCLLIELSEDSYCETAEYKSSVKYFWMKISPEIFKEN